MTAKSVISGLPKKCGDPCFHAQNVYAVVMRTLCRFEAALGRRISWAFLGHQVQAAPHAFADANAFYSRRDQALFFGYFPGKSGTVFTALAHDVIAHETTHALIDGLRERFTDPSSPDQAGFHEGLADVIAILSVFTLQRNFRIEPTATRQYTIQTLGTSDTIVVLFEDINGELRYKTADDDSGQDRNARIRTKLFKGRKYVARVRLYYQDNAGETSILLS